ncbi:MAG TPA: tetratricopeptide repeat protein [Saprospiraceae bacterium]|nr:tetratricopeptide repeat protein [Saprospiraceae bacterium]HMQ82030.1 tetratricopeptide repeat protein [Saprospiraceae bacterium]
MTSTFKLLTKYLAVFCILLGELTPSFAQVTESDVNLQNLFIDASREKILGRYDKALELFNALLELDPQNAAAAYELARIHEANGDDNLALRWGKSAAEWDAENLWYQRYLADVYQRMNLNKEAAEIFRQIIVKEPDNPDNYFRLAYFLVRSNEISKALKVYEQLEAMIGIDEEIIRRKHTLYLGLGDDKKAVLELERLIAAYPSNTEYRHLLAGYYEQSNEHDKALAVYQQILSIDPSDARAQLAMAESPGKVRDELQYMESLKPVFRQPDVSIDLKIGKIMPFINEVARSGDQELAAATLELTQILERVHPDDAKGYSATADLLYYSNNKKDALSKYLQTLELDDSVFLVWEQIMHIYRETKQYAALLKFSENAMDYFPNQAIAHYMYGLAASEMENYNEALSALMQAQLMSGKNGYLKMLVSSRLAWIYNRQGAFQKSDEYFQAAFDLQPESPEVSNEYSLALIDRGKDLDKALKIMEKANHLVPNQAAYEATHARILYKMGKYDKAQEWLEKARSHGGEQDPDVLEYSGDLAYQFGDLEQALEYWKKARDLGSVSKMLDKKITDKKVYE